MAFEDFLFSSVKVARDRRRLPQEREGGLYFAGFGYHLYLTGVVLVEARSLWGVSFAVLRFCAALQTYVCNRSSTASLTLQHSEFDLLLPLPQICSLCKHGVVTQVLMLAR
jgi:hypothetical protein